MANVQSLVNSIGSESDGDEGGMSKMLGIPVGVLIDTSTGDLSFQAFGKSSSIKFKVSFTFRHCNV